MKNNEFALVLDHSYKLCPYSSFQNIRGSFIFMILAQIEAQFMHLIIQVVVFCCNTNNLIGGQKGQFVLLNSGKIHSRFLSHTDNWKT